VLLLALALLTALASCSEPKEPREMKTYNVVFVSLDTARADHFGMYGYERSTTPRLDALARRGIVFDQAVTVSNNTLISHASMLTGLFPASHGTTPKGEGVALGGDYRTIAEDFAAAGYQTTCFAAHMWITEKFGMHQGFEVFWSAYREAPLVLFDATMWMTKVRDKERPFFLFIHLYDAHSDFTARPYDSHPPFVGTYTKGYDGPLKAWDDQEKKASEFLADVRDGKIELTPEDARYLADQYDEGLAYLDDQIGKFLASLDCLDDTILVITADHGEEFYDHGSALHRQLYDEVVRIPLLIVPPAELLEWMGGARHVEEQVRTIDLRPTMLSLAGQARPEECQGVDLTSWLFGDRDDCPAGPARLYQNGGVRHDGFKLIREDGVEMLFDLDADPDESENLVEDESLRDRVRRMVAVLNEEIREDQLIRERLMGDSDQAPPAMDPEEAERLRKLGYTFGDE